jgi:hypothetical protein
MGSHEPGATPPTAVLASNRAQRHQSAVLASNRAQRHQSAVRLARRPKSCPPPLGHGEPFCLRSAYVVYAGSCDTVLRVLCEPGPL